MKAIELNDLLSEKEKKEFKSGLKNHPRAALYQLHDAISKSTTPGKGEMYRSFTGKKYSKDVDYVLRNELRLLSKEIELFIIQQEAKAKFLYENACVNIWLLERMLSKNQFHEFEAAWKQLLQTAEKQVDTNAINQLLKIYAEYKVKNSEISYKELMEQLSLVNSSRETAQWIFDEQLSELQINNDFSKANLLAINAEQTETSQGFISLPVNALKTITDYNRMKAESYLLHGERKINVLIRLSKLVKEVQKFRELPVHELSNIYGNAGLEFFLQKKYQPADEFYKKAIDASPVNAPNLGLLFNYGINALMLGKYNTMQNVYANYQEEIEKSEKTKHRFRYFTAISFLFDNKHEKAFRLLENDLSKRPAHEYYYYRIVYAMVFFDSGEYQLAERKLNNLLQSIRKNKKAVIEDKSLVMAFQQLVQTVDTFRNHKSYQKKISDVVKKMMVMQKNESNFSVIIYQWLLAKIKKLNS